MPSNVSDKPLINLRRDSETSIHSTLMCDRKTRLTAEVDTNRGDILVRDFWLQNTDYVADVYICDINQLSYLSSYPVAILKLAEAQKKRKYLAASLE